MGEVGNRLRAAFGRWRRRAVERFAVALVRAFAWNKRVRRTMLRAIHEHYIPPDRLYLAQFADHAFFVSPRDQTIGFELLSGKPWQRQELERAVHILEREQAFAPDGIFTDIGANIGTQTVYAMLTGRFAGGVAIEAASGNFDLLKRNLDWNGLSGTVEAVHAAACAAVGDVELRLNRANAGGHSLSPTHLRTPFGSERVRGDTADALLRQTRGGWRGVSLAWIDVEGLETDVLAGMPEALGAGIPVVFEYTPSVARPEDWARLQAAFLANRYDRSARLQDGEDAAPIELAERPAPETQCDLVVWRSTGEDKTHE